MNTRMLLATDLDRTLLPNGVPMESPAARPLFSRVAARPEVVLVYVTGRHRALVEAAIAEYVLPIPQYVIGDVGSSLYRLVRDEWRVEPTWQAVLAQDWQHIRPADLAKALTSLTELTLQESEQQTPWKLSYYAPFLEDAAALLAEVRERLALLTVRFNLVWSLDEAKNCGLLDVLPEQAGKLQALEFLRTKLNIPEKYTLFAGDSGNDLDVLASALPAVLVANAANSVREQALKRAYEQGNADRLYLAKGGFAGMDGHYAAGILEGLAHFIPEAQNWLTPEEVP